VLLEAGAARVYAVDAGHGQLLGSLRQDPRVVVLERTNLGDLTPGLVPDELDVITMDLSYLPIARAAPQLDPLRISPRADLVALVKPQHELSLGAPPADRQVRAAVEHAARGLEVSGWRVVDAVPSPVTGSRGAVECLLHARCKIGPDVSPALASLPEERGRRTARPGPLRSVPRRKETAMIRTVRPLVAVAGLQAQRAPGRRRDPPGRRIRSGPAIAGPDPSPSRGCAVQRGAADAHCGGAASAALRAAAGEVIVGRS
jgi:hypothetical protein